MKSITSVSGGKSSAMMAVEFPTDHYIFAVVLTDQIDAQPKDKGLLRECQNRIPHFVASRELDLTLLNMLKLEQLIGKRIDWVAAEFTYDALIRQSTDQAGYRSGKTMLPNANKRFCTEQLKLVPMFWHCYLNHFDGEPLLMNIGFRADEPKRIEGWTCDKDKFDYPSSCSTGLSKDFKSSSLFMRERQKWEEIEWRITEFPLNQYKIDRLDVAKYWLDKGWQFPSVSNCDFCFNHRGVEQQRQAELFPDRAQWWIDFEQESGKTFGDHKLTNILTQPLLDVYGNTEPCHCTD